jgi:hypothetical protein
MAWRRQHSVEMIVHRNEKMQVESINSNNLIYVFGWLQDITKVIPHLERSKISV